MKVSDSDFKRMILNNARRYGPYKYNDHADKVLILLKDNFDKLDAAFCPCQPEQTAGTICPCSKFRESGECCCGLFVKPTVAAHMKGE